MSIGSTYGQAIVCRSSLEQKVKLDGGDREMGKCDIKDQAFFFKKNWCLQFQNRFQCLPVRNLSGPLDKEQLPQASEIEK